ncbi:hypothetical protein MEO40_26930, partial [Dolichospermum sp. ST_sed1]|nr:hypothetical protein [Dolichospermum sp. ST_sed1]
EGKTLDQTLPVGDAKSKLTDWMVKPLGVFFVGEKKNISMTAADVIDMEKGLTQFTYVDFVKSESAASLADGGALVTPTRTAPASKLTQEIEVASFEGSEGFQNKETHFIGKLSFKKSPTASWENPQILEFLDGLVKQYKQNTLHYKHLELMIKNVKVPMSSMLRGKGLQVNIAWNELRNVSAGSVDLALYGFFNDPGLEFGGNPNAGHANHNKGVDIRLNLQPLVEKTQNGQELLAILRSVLTLKGELFQFNSARELETLAPGVTDTEGMVTDGDRVITGPILSGVVASLIKNSNAFLILTEVK